MSRYTITIEGKGPLEKLLRAANASIDPIQTIFDFDVQGVVEQGLSDGSVIKVEKENEDA